MAKACPMPATTTAPDPALTPTTIMSVLLFDTAGNIVHGHQEAFLPNAAAQPIPVQVEANARRAYAAQNPSKSANVDALHLVGALTDNLCTGVSYKVIDCKLVKG